MIRRAVLTFNAKASSMARVKTYSTKQAAKRARIHEITLHRWIAAGKVRPSVALRVNGTVLAWRWTAADLARLVHYKTAHYRKGGGRKKKRPRRRRG
jgi:hypothetical protein